MSRYTQSVKSIIMENMQPGESISNINDILACAKRCIFDVQNLQSMLGDNTDRFELGFVLHFFNDEIGLETPFLWKMGIVEKVYNNNEYINSIYETLENQILADYNTRVVDGATHDSIVDEGTVANTGTVENAKTGDDTVKNTGTSANAKTGTETGAHTGTDTQVKSGFDSVTRTGQEDDSHTGSNSHAKTGHDAVTKSGTETHTYNNVKDNVKDLDGSNDWTENQEHYADTVVNESSDKNNSGTYNLDTPMDAIENLRSTNDTPPAPYDATGKGISALADSSMKYMTNASLSDGTTVNKSEQTTRHDDGGEHGEVSKVINHYEKESETTRTGSEQDSYANREDRTDYSSTMTDTFNEHNQKTYNNVKDKSDYNSTNQSTKNLQDTTTFNTNDTRTDNLQSKTEYNSENTTTNDLLTTKENSTTKDSTNDVTETSKNLNLEMVYRSMPLLNKVWEIFDELFMMLY